MKIEPQLQDFCTKHLRNRWLTSREMKVYLRHSGRCLEPSDHPTFSSPNCLDIASIEVAEPYQKQGLFSAFILLAEKTTDMKYLYLENINNTILLDWVKKYDWNPVNDGESYYKKINKEKPNA